jgi:S-adenosylmethionine:tRNA ribosyltransferase-isomerase
MKVDLFDFPLPTDLIAQRPAEPRDSARLLHVAAGGTLHDRIIRELPALLAPGDILVSNDTKVIPARLTGQRGQAKIEVTLHKREGLARWRAFARPARRLKAGDTIVFAADFSATVGAKGEAGEVTLDFSAPGGDLMAALAKHGVMPLPPYIKRGAGGDPQDRHDYQTVFAREPGAVAAPTAGLHFTPALLDALDARGVQRITLTLHVGAGTFLPVKVDDTQDHVMHSEWGSLPAATAETLNAGRARGGRIVAVGTTSLRLLESAAGDDRHLRAFEGDTALFITPGYRFKAVDRLLTNFHLPRSTLFMLVSAFSGLERMKAAYNHAVTAGYRFYSYGDACLLEPAAS